MKFPIDITRELRRDLALQKNLRLLAGLGVFAFVTLMGLTLGALLSSIPIRLQLVVLAVLAQGLWGIWYLTRR